VPSVQLTLSQHAHALSRVGRLLNGQAQHLHCRHLGRALAKGKTGNGCLPVCAPSNPNSTPNIPARMHGANVSRHARDRREEAAVAGEGTPVAEDAEASADDAHDWGARLRDEAWASDDDDAAWSTCAGACRRTALAACLAACACGGRMHQGSARRGAAAPLALRVCRGMSEHERLVSGQPRSHSRQSPGGADVSIAWRRPERACARAASAAAGTRRAAAACRSRRTRTPTRGPSAAARDAWGAADAAARARDGR